MDVKNLLHSWKKQRKQGKVYALFPYFNDNCSDDIEVELGEWVMNIGIIFP